MKKLDVRTYDDYITLKNNPTESFLMISELIDNSISSFDNQHGGIDWGNDKLEIKVDFYFDKKVKKDVHGTLAQSNSYVRVIDNAYGMDEEQLINAIRLNKKNDESISINNRHGRGLKQCAFYFGATLDIETWKETVDADGNKRDIINSIVLDTNAFKSDDEVMLETIPLKEYELQVLNSRGTAISIFNVFDIKTFTEKKFDDLKNSITYRYIKLIKDGKLEIKYCNKINEEVHYKGEDDINEYFTEFSEHDEFISKVSQNFNYGAEKMSKVINLSREGLMELIKDGGSRIGVAALIKYEKTREDAFAAISGLLMKSVFDNETEYHWEQVLNINGKELPVRFWRLQKGTSRYRGFRVFEGERALLHPPMSDDGTGPSTYYEPVFPSSSETGSTENRFAGEFDITKIGATTTTDKSKFIFNSSKDEEELNEQLSMIWRIYNTFEINGRSNTKVEGKMMNKKDAYVIKSVMESKFGKYNRNIEVYEDNNKDMVVAFELLVNDKYWKLEIRTDNQEYPAQIWNKQKGVNDDGEEVLLITAYTSHPIWRRMDRSKGFFQESLLPITTFVVHYEISNITEEFEKDEIKDELDLDKIVSSSKSAMFGLNHSGEILEE